MTESPPTKPETHAADEPELSIQEQLDLLLAQIETQEPGTIDPAALPKSYARSVPEPAAKQVEAPPAPEADAAPEPAPVPAQETYAEAVESFEQAMQDPPTEPAAEATPEPAAEAVTETAAPATPEPADDAEADMLAALNAALKDLGGSDKPDTPKADAAPAAAEAAAPDTAPPKDTQQQLQDEINALLNADPAAPEPPASRAEPAAEAPPADAAGLDLSPQDQLAKEIEGLLNVGEPSEQAEADPSIDDLDQMLADEIDEDDELAGDFQSVQDVTAGIVTGHEDDAIEVDEHAAGASARDVAAELDSQPEDLAEPEPAEQPVAAKAERQPDTDTQAPRRDWRSRVRRGNELLLRACFTINWPARRFMNYEWRANIGYIALLNLFFGVAIWIYLFVL